MGLFWRIWGAAIGVIFAVGFLLVTLVTLEFKRDYDRLLGERLLVVASSASAPFSAAAELGLAMSSVRNASALLDIARQADPLITGVWVLDAHSRPIAQASSQIRAEQGLSLPELPDARSQDGWFSTIGDAFLAGVEIRDATGQPVGQLLVAYPLEISHTRVLAMVAELSLIVSLIALGFSLAAGGVLRWWIDGEIREFSDVTADLESFERQVWTRQRSDDDTASPGSLHTMLNQSRSAYLGVLGYHAAHEIPRDSEQET